ncbi:MAG TPA: hypothetical protein VK860_05155, partial [Ilumatobacteraceae bacterium]|nr:hypothetical protein [Ilumatobacteraceae bacterium]
MRTSTLIGGLAAAAASMVLVLPPPGASAQIDGEGDLYSDLYVALRDEDGVPITTTFDTAEGPVECIQPISYVEIPGIASVENPVDGRDVFLVPLVGEPTPAPAVALEEDEAEPCDPQLAYAEYVSEVELERLNLVRTNPSVLWRKLVEVGARLAAATEITLDGAGRITTDGTPIDASPEHAATYAAAEGADPATQPGGLMDTGTIPGTATVPLPLGDRATITEGTGQFDEWMLAAAALGTAGGKSVPLSIDAVEYYNRIASPNGDVSEWGHVSVLPQTALGEEFVDYRTFEYTRTDVFTGCTTWLDIGTLTWMSGPIVERVEFTDVVDAASTRKVTNVAGFTQMADDVRSVINYLHENEVVVDPLTGDGFYIDPVFTETCAAQAEKVVELNQPVDAVDPTVAITVAPPAETISTTATFEFVTTDAASVLCVLDSGAIERCDSPVTYSDLELGAHTFNVIAMGVAGNFVSDSHTWQVIRPGEDSMIVSMDPVRLADTRPGWVAADGLFFGTGPIPSGRTIQVPVAGRGGVPADAKAVVANVAVVGASTPGFVTVFPCGTRPGTASLN